LLLYSACIARRLRLLFPNAAGQGFEKSSRRQLPSFIAHPALVRIGGELADWARPAPSTNCRSRMMTFCHFHHDNVAGRVGARTGGSVFPLAHRCVRWSDGKRTALYLDRIRADRSLYPWSDVADFNVTTARRNSHDLGSQGAPFSASRTTLKALSRRPM
jgi:hypothetical protein